MARMSIDDKFLRDPRITQLAINLGMSRWEVMGRLIAVFAVCYDLERDVLTCTQVDLAAQHPGFGDEMFACELTVNVRGGMRIKGAGERIAYLEPKREAGRIGGIKSGESRRNKREAKRKQTREANEASPNPPDPVPDPAPDPVPDQRSESLSAHAIPPSTEPTPLPSTTPAQSFAERDLAKLRERGALAEATWLRLSAMREKHATKLRLAGSLPFPLIHPGNHPRGFRELLDRIREEGDNAHAACDHVLAVLDKQAADTKSIEWLAEKAFLAGPWEKARNTPLAKRKPPAAAKPSDEPVFSTLSPEERIALAAEANAKLYGRKEPA